MSTILKMQPKKAQVREDFLGAWLTHHAPLPTAKLFLEWAGLFTVGAAVGRRVWIKGSSLFPPLYPNLYLALVGPPGSGKDIAINSASRLIERANKTLDSSASIHLAGESMSGKGIIDRVASDRAQKSFRWFDGEKEQTCTYHSIVVCAPELGTILPEYDTRLISNLNELYNCKDSFQETVRGGTGHITVENPHVALLLGTQPNTLASILPEQTFSMGFTSRIIFVYASEIHRQPIIQEDIVDSTDSHRSLAEDLRRITELSGRFSIPKTTAELINDFHITGADTTALLGQRFEHYNTRRSLHAQKIAMLISISEGDSLSISPSQWERAIGLLFKTEAVMQDIFIGLSSSRGFIDRLEDLTVYGGVITHAQAVATLARRSSPGEIGYVISTGIATTFLRDIPDSKPKAYSVHPEVFQPHRSKKK
jgi:hypothetical protein